MIILIAGLIGISVVAALVLSLTRNRPIRDVIVRIASALLIAGSILVYVASYGKGALSFTIGSSEQISLGLVVIELAVAAYLIFASVRRRNWMTLTLTIVQIGLVLFAEITAGRAPSTHSQIYVDQLTVLMILVAGIIGSIICIYSTGYMRSYHYFHPEIPDRRRRFFFLEFIFLAAMFGIVVSNDLQWLAFFWEITTFCSFLLIGYTDNEESRRNSFFALAINLGGGIALTLAVIFLSMRFGIHDLVTLTSSHQLYVMIPVALFCFAGFTKSAQLPFSGWLLGAMVAPTPVSALLHSSTMVKAGVYLIVRMSPLLTGSVLGYAVTIVGGFTFLVTSFLAISQTNAKRMLAYSTVANLGLIVACAGIGNYETLWVALFIILFHAVAKSLLFLGVGVVGYKLHSVDIEEMDNLVVRFPALALMIVVGICGMFIAPFGMLISKWAALEAFINLQSWVGPIIIFFLAYGSAATIFFWAKWMGKIVSVNRSRWIDQPQDKRISRDEWLSMGSLTALTIVTVVGFALISTHLVEPFVNSAYGFSRVMERSNLILTTVMMAMIIVIPLFLLLVPRRSRTKLGPVYMAGRETTADLVYKSSSSGSTQLTLRNYYLSGLFGEKRLFRVGIFVGLLLILFVFGAAFL